jgi:predicted small lipoprotein YifL
MKRLLLAFLLVAAALPLVGCGSKTDDYDPNKIAVKQPGNGPPPMNAPMSQKPSVNGN